MRHLRCDAMTHVPQPRPTSTTFAVAFDMDGLLVDTEPVWWRAEREVAESLGGTWTDEDSVSCVGGPMEKVADIIIARAGQGERQTIIDAVIDRVASLLGTHQAQWLPGARELLVDLSDRGVPVALVSASPRKVMAAVLAALGTDADRFNFTVSADDVVRTKPDPMPYLEAAARFGIAPGQLVVFEDSGTGIRSAVDSGAIVYAVPHTKDVNCVGVFQMLTSLHEISCDELMPAMMHTQHDAPQV